MSQPSPGPGAATPARSHDIVPVSLDMNEKDNELAHHEHFQTAEEIRRTLSKGGVVQMRSKFDDLGILQSLSRYRYITLVAMAAAFSASLDGYRECCEERPIQLLEGGNEGRKEGTNENRPTLMLFCDL